MRHLVFAMLFAMGAANGEVHEHGARGVPANRGIRNGLRGSTRGRHYTRRRRLEGDDNNNTYVGKRHVVLTADNRQSSWRDARRMASHMM